MSVKIAKNLKRESVFINKYGEKIEKPKAIGGDMELDIRTAPGTAGLPRSDKE